MSSPRALKLPPELRALLGRPPKGRPSGAEDRRPSRALPAAWKGEVVRVRETVTCDAVGAPQMVGAASGKDAVQSRVLSGDGQNIIMISW